MRVYIKGQNNGINLGKSDYLTKGGEGEIYLKNNSIFKIYFNLKKIIPYAKIKELGKINYSNVIKPELLVLNTKFDSIGYTMKYIADTYPLCKTFTKIFRQRTKLDDKVALSLIRRMQETIGHIHSKNILIVDLNELNFLVKDDFSEIFFIDVDSYKTPSFPPTAIMQNIRDRHSSSFSENTDWFSFGIVSFQMFIGIHPFQGKYKPYGHLDADERLDARMKNNISVFREDVTYPRVCRSLEIIPEAYRRWYEAIFEGRTRVPPPDNIQSVVVIAPEYQEVKSNSDLEIIKIQEFNEEILDFFSDNGIEFVETTDKIYSNNKSHKIKKDCVFALTPKKNTPFVGWLENDKLKLYNLEEEKEQSTELTAEEIMSYNGRIFTKNQNKLLEINFIEFSNLLQITSRIVCNVLEKATVLYDGLIIQDMLGSFIVSIFPKINHCYQLNISELNKYKIIDAKYDNHVLMVIGSKDGNYDKFIIKIDDKYENYSIRKVENITYCGINFVVLDNGIAVSINEQEQIEVFSNKKDSNGSKIIENEGISGDMRLFKNGIQVLFGKEKKLYRIKIKK